MRLHPDRRIPRFLGTLVFGEPGEPHTFIAYDDEPVEHVDRITDIGRWLADLSHHADALKAEVVLRVQGNNVLVNLRPGIEAEYAIIVRLERAAKRLLFADEHMETSDLLTRAAKWIRGEPT